MIPAFWQKAAPNQEVVAHLADCLKISFLTAVVLVNRGITDVKTAEAFLAPKLTQLSDPLLIPNITRAAQRVLLARERGEKVLVYGDYDVDGVSGTALLMHLLRFLNIPAEYYIPHRYGEGYGLSIDAVEQIAKRGIKLIITVDCGIASVEEITEAKRLGMEVVVTDHHNLPPVLPSAYALVNPKLIEEESSVKYLSGAGVAFKFAWAILKIANLKEVEFLTSLLDLAALGTFADVVPLSGENRILAVNGLRLINERKRLGIRCLAEAAGIKGDINEERIYYMLAPRINAAGRLEHASKAVELFLSGDLAETQKLAGELSTINTRRQGIGEEIREAVFTRIDDDYLKQNQVIVLHGDNWHPGVIGIVASRVAETYHRPTVLIGINEGVGRGSARSVAGINVYALLDSCRDLFLDFGGHEGAAGMEVALENIPELEKRLKETAERLIAPEDLTPKLLIDAELDLQQLSLGVVKELAKLAPFGEGNPLPLFMSQGLEISQLRVVGKEGKHLKLKLKGEGGVELSAIGFGMGHLQDKLAYGKKYTVAYHLTANEWEGFERVELELVDISATS